jgi:hypothetical protein
MEAEVIDSLWEVARQEQDQYHDLFLVAKVVYQEGHRDIYRLGFDQLDQVISYFQMEELGDGVFDREDRVILFHYDRPTGPITYLYAFYRDETFNAVVSALANRLKETNLDLGISRKVIDDYDPGIYPPFIGEDTSLVDIDIQDFTDADLRRENSFISTDLYRRPTNGSIQRPKANECSCRRRGKKLPNSTSR